MKRRTPKRRKKFVVPSSAVAVYDYILYCLYVLLLLIETK